MVLNVSLLLLINLSQIIAQTVVIKTQLGEIKGLVNTPTGKQKTYSFCGIRYGIAPILDLRFRPAQLNSAKWDGIYDATEFGDECMQPGKTNGISEDCLFLNVWTANINSSKLLPVMFWIHGGGFSSGSSSEFDATNLVGEGRNFVYVSINYRLGSFGFLQNQALYDEDPNWKSYGGMNGISDQIQALKYVKQYIMDYGGDPNAVTIFGESAGGSSVCTLCITPLAKGLFSRAIIESGACNGPWGAMNVTFGLEVYNSMLENAGYPIDNLTYLRSIPAEQFEQAMGSWTWVVDDLIVSDTQGNIYANLHKNVFNPEQLIIGFNTMDAYMINNSRPSTDTEYQTYLNYYVTNSTQTNLLYSLYYPAADFPPYYGVKKYNEYQLAWITIIADVCLTCPSLKVAEQIDSTIDNDVVYVYRFGGPGNNGSYYAAHGAEISFVYDNEVSYQAVPWSQLLSNEMVSGWTNFCKYGVPNITDEIDNVNVEWNAFGGGARGNVMILEDTVQIKSMWKQNYRSNVCDFWENQVGDDVMFNICFMLPV